MDFSTQESSLVEGSSDLQDHFYNETHDNDAKPIIEEQEKNKIKKIPGSLSLYEYDRLLKLVVIGDVCTEKTSVLLRFTEEDFNDSYLCTIGVDFKFRTLKVDDKIVKLQIWDTAGQERFKSVAHSYYRNSSGCIAVYDVTNRQSFDNIMEIIEYYKSVVSKNTRPECSSLTQSSFTNSVADYNNIILVGNKSDLEKERKVSYEEGQNLAKKYGLGFYETSAKKGKNVDECFYELVLKTYNNSLNNDKKELSNNELTVNQDKKKKSRCC